MKREGGSKRDTGDGEMMSAAPGFIRGSIWFQTIKLVWTANRERQRKVEGPTWDIQLSWVGETVLKNIKKKIIY